MPCTSALLDGEGIVYDQNGIPDFNLIHSKEYDRYVSLVAFDLLEKDGEDLRPLPLIERRGRLQHLVAKVREGIEFVEHIEGDGAHIFEAACELGHEGIVAKRMDAPYESGRSKRWVKIKNPRRRLQRGLRTEASKSGAESGFVRTAWLSERNCNPTFSVFAQEYAPLPLVRGDRPGIPTWPVQPRIEQSYVKGAFKSASE